MRTNAHAYTHTHTHTQKAYATFVTSHTLVISKDTKPTRSPTQFPRMPKWSCKQALSLTGRKGTGKKILMLEKRRRRKMEGSKERGWKRRKETGGGFLLNTLSYQLYKVLRQKF